MEGAKERKETTIRFGMRMERRKEERKEGGEKGGRRRSKKEKGWKEEEQ